MWKGAITLGSAEWIAFEGIADLKPLAGKCSLSPCTAFG